MHALVERVPSKWRTTVAAIGGLLAYLIALQLPGIGDYLNDKMPLAVVVIGLITGTVTALLAIGLILIYRANRFINFAYGAMGSFVGVIGGALYLEHHWSHWVGLPLAGG